VNLHQYHLQPQSLEVEITGWRWGWIRGYFRWWGGAILKRSFWGQNPKGHQSNLIP
jgi:hypothetical protein